MERAFVQLHLNVVNSVAEDAPDARLLDAFIYRFDELLWDHVTGNTALEKAAAARLARKYPDPGERVVIAAPDSPYASTFTLDNLRQRFLVFDLWPANRHLDVELTP